MDLDDRAARAADSLRRQVEPMIDLGRARDAVAETGQRRSRARRARVAATTLAVVAVLGLFAVVGGTGAGGGRLRTGLTDGDERNSGEQARAAAIIGALPAGPLDGKESWRLPVVAKPQSGLADGDTITIYGRGFEPNESLGIVQCSSEADTDAAGVGGCQLASEPRKIEDRPAVDEYGGYGEDAPGDTYTDSFGAVTYANADEDGNVVADVEVRRWITTPEGGRIDCFSAAERCLVGVGAISNYDRSGGTYIDFAEAPDFEVPTVALSPAGAVTPGQPVLAQLRGWVPERSVRFSQCIEDRCQKLADAKVDLTGAVAQQVVLQPTIVDDETGDEVTCEDRCVLRAAGIGPKASNGATASHAPFPDDVALTFTDTEPSIPATATTIASAPDTTATTSPSVATTVPLESDGPSTTVTTEARPPTETGDTTTSTAQSIPGTSLPGG